MTYFIRGRAVLFSNARQSIFEPFPPLISFEAMMRIGLDWMEKRSQKRYPFLSVLLPILVIEIPLLFFLFLPSLC